MVCYTALLQQHKEEAQPGLEYYKRLASEAESMYKHKCTMQQLELTPERLAELDRLQLEYSTFISADYMMGPSQLITLTFFDHYIRIHVDEWVRHLTLCLDNTRICKNQYLVGWVVELVENRFDSIQLF